MHRLLSDTGAPRPMRSRVTHGWQQVSWLAGRRLRPPSQSTGSSGFLVVGYPPTVAGAAAELPTEVDAPHSLG